MSGDPIILGINSVYHESSACVVRGTDVLAIAEEERFNRRKHGKQPEVTNADEVPTFAIRDCLSRAGLGGGDVDFVAYSFDPSLRGTLLDEPAVPGSWGSPEGERRFLESLDRVPAAVGRVLIREVSDRWVWVEHELAHAASAYFASPFNESAVLSFDGIGEQSTVLLGYGHDGNLERLGTMSYPDSLGFVWEKFSKFLGFDEYAAPKLMALAAFASPESYREKLERIFSPNPLGFKVDLDHFRFRVEDYEPLEKLFGPRRRRGEPLHFRHAEVCAALQAVTEDILFGLARYLRDVTGSSNLCIAGGVGLNCVAMGRLLNEGPFEGVFVQPLAHDAGTALGAALWVAHSKGHVSSRFVMTHPDFGSTYDDTEVKAVLAEAPVMVRTVASPEAEAARLMADGLIVGWYQGAGEVGPRALGNRSILADPRRPESKDLINLKVKHREFFRPFASSVLEEHAAEWFVLSRKSVSTRFMSFAVPVRPDKRALVPAVVHVDGTSRVQTVSAVTNPRFHALITNFHSRTRIPLVLNTSLNTLDEPIVWSPLDALRTFLGTGMDAMILHNYLVERTHPKRSETESNT